MINKVDDALGKIDLISQSGKFESDFIYGKLHPVLIGLPEEDLMTIHLKVLEDIRNSKFANVSNAEDIEHMLRIRLKDHTVVFHAEEKKKREEERMRKEEEERMRKEEEEKKRKEDSKKKGGSKKRKEGDGAKEKDEPLSESMKLFITIAEDCINKLNSGVYKKKISLSSDKKKELNSLYKKISKICHPDKLEEGLKKYGEDIFKDLGAAKGAGHLYRLRELDIALQQYFEEKSKE